MGTGPREPHAQHTPTAHVACHHRFCRRNAASVEQTVDLNSFAPPPRPPRARTDNVMPLLVLQEFIKRFPKTDHPAAFGQHVNADITSLIEETSALLGTMVSLFTIL